MRALWLVPCALFLGASPAWALSCAMPEAANAELVFKGKIVNTKPVSLPERDPHRREPNMLAVFKVLDVFKGKAGKQQEIYFYTPSWDSISKGDTLWLFVNYDTEGKRYTLQECQSGGEQLNPRTRAKK